jgi:drug/metabolite transporter, DME family
MPVRRPSTDQTRRVSVRATGISAALAIVLSAVLFGSTGTAQALGPDAATPYGVGAIRIAIGAVVLWGVAGRLPRVRTLRDHPRSIALGAVGVAAYQPGFFTGTDRLGVALGTIVALGSGPVFAGIIEWLRGNRPTARWMVATGLAIGGGSLVVLSGDSGARFSGVGLLGALAAGLGYALYAVATRGLIGRGVPSTEASAWQFTIGAVVLLPLLATQPLGWLGSVGGVAMAVHLGVVCTGLAYVLYGWGLRLIDTATATSLTLAEPVTAACLAVVVLDERLRWFGWGGALVVLAGLMSIGGGLRSNTVTPAA